MPLFGTRGAASVTGFGGLAKLGYLLRNSLRFRGANSAYLSRTPSVTGNRKVWTWSGWVKRGQLDSGADDRVLFSSPSQSGNDGIAAIYFDSDQLHTYYDTSGANPYGPIGPRLYRDPAAWYHIVWAVDAANTIHYVYVNNELVSTDPSYYPPNYEYSMNRSGGYTHTMGTQAWGATNYFDGYMAEVNFVDGQALTPSSFGKTDGATGQWIPIKYSGTYGTNGFYLNFTDASAATAAAIGKDSSGNGNNWTPNNISVTAGATYDSMTDVPTLTSATAANYCVLNPLDKLLSPTVTNGNLSATVGDNAEVRGSIYVSSGKWYWEVVPTTMTFSMIGVGIGGSGIHWGTGVSYYGFNGNKYVNGSASAYGASYTNNDVIGIALDLDNLQITFYKNNTSQGTITGLTAGLYRPALSAAGDSSVYNANFGQRPFAYTPPSGFKNLNTFNLP